MENKEEQFSYKIFVVKTTTGQEKNVARLISAKVEMTKLPIKALLVPDTLKGYVFIEADGPHIVEEAIAGVRHVRSRIPGLQTLVPSNPILLKSNGKLEYQRTMTLKLPVLG